MIFLDIVESCIRGIDGRLGKYIRYNYYRHRLKYCGKGVTIDTGVFLLNPSMIELGESVWLDKNVILIAGRVNLKSKKVRYIENTSFAGKTGEIVIGAYSHIGIGTIIQGHGGVLIDKYFTTSAGCKIYSFSNDPKLCRTGTLHDPAYIFHPVSIGENVWLGMNTIILGHHVGKDTFIQPNSKIYIDVPMGVIFDSANDQYKERF